MTLRDRLDELGFDLFADDHADAVACRKCRREYVYTYHASPEEIAANCAAHRCPEKR
jgi:hypothetical protein